MIGGKGGKPPGRLIGALGPDWSVFSVRIGREGIVLGGFSGAAPPIVGMLTPMPPDNAGILGFTEAFTEMLPAGVAVEGELGEVPPDKIVMPPAPDGLAE